MARANLAKTEAQVRDPVVKWAKKMGLRHVRMSFRPGVTIATPDDLFLSTEGRSAWIEFKRPGKEPTPLQWERLRWLYEHGHAAEWHDNANQAKDFLRLNLF